MRVYRLTAIRVGVLCLIPLTVDGAGTLDGPQTVTALASVKTAGGASVSAPLTVVVRRFTTDGKELARNDDSALYVQDPVLSIAAPRDGAYFIDPLALGGSGSRVVAFRPRAREARGREGFTVDTGERHSCAGNAVRHRFDNVEVHRRERREEAKG